MAKRTRDAGPASTRSKSEHRIEAFADDLGRLLGTARAKAEGWLGQREAIAKHLADIRDTATGLLAQLTGGKLSGAPANGRRRRSRTSAGPSGAQKIRKRRRRRLSAEARERIAEAQRRRWAKQKAAQK